MDANVLQYSYKLKKLLGKLLEKDFEVKSDSDFNTLLSHLSGKENPELGKVLLGLDILTEWVIEACSYWEKNQIRPPLSIGRFCLELASLLSRDEATFTRLSGENVYLRLIDTLQVQADNSSANIKLAFIKLLLSFLGHKTGFEWIVSTNLWTHVHSYCMTNPTLYIIRNSYEFMYRLLEAAVLYNDVFCNCVIRKTMQPLMANELRNDSSKEVDDEQLKNRLTPSLRLIIYLLEQYLRKECINKNNQLIPQLFLKNYHLVQSVSTFMIIAKNKDLVFDLGNLSMLIAFVDLCNDACESMFKLEELTATIKVVYTILIENSKSGHCMNVIKFCYLALHYWSLVLPRIPESYQHPLYREHIKFENQMALLFVAPLFTFSLNNIITREEAELDEIRDDFIMKLFKILHEETLRFCWSWKEQLSKPEIDIIDMSLKSIYYIMQARKYFRRECAVMIFQSLMYFIKDVTKLVKEKPKVLESMPKLSGLLYSVLDSVGVFIEEYEITWRDCIETICVMGATIFLISLTKWPTKLEVQSLKLINLSIAKYMSPNLALLVDETSNTSMSLLCPLLAAKLRDESWEIRDSALEVLTVISEYSQHKFPSFQDVVLEGDLARLAVELCTSDSQSFVRASALKCLQEMIKVPAFWNSSFNKQELLHKLQTILNEETEAIVRSEAASLVAKIYKHQSFPEETMPQIYEMMAYAATLDLHWEVKIRAFEFWDTFITQQLNNQGMIDGAFPTVTFSKENRKIVTLTDMEIHRRLVKVLEQLSECGCLSVLLSAMQDDCDLEVVKVAVDTTKKLVQLLNRYKLTVQTYNRLPRSLSSSSTGSIDSPSTSSQCRSESGEDCFNKASDIMASPVPSLSMSSGSSIRIASPIHFLEYVKRDLDELVTSRKKWLTNMNCFESVLEDMLKSYDDDFGGVNTMDCY